MFIREISCQFFLFILCLNSMRCISSCYNPFYLCMWTWYQNKCKIDWIIRTNSTFTCHLHNTMHSSSQLLYRCTESWMSSPKVMIVSCMQDMYIFTTVDSIFLKRIIGKRRWTVMMPDRIFVCFRDDSHSPERKEKKKKSKKHKRDR